MSHLPHVISLKQELIKLGVTHPTTQDKIASTAYTKAMISVIAKYRNKEDKTSVFFHRVLNYWNEIIPIDGFYIFNAVTSFFKVLQSEIETLTKNEIKVSVGAEIENVDESTYADLESYRSLIEILKKEAEEQLVAFKAAEESNV